MAEATVSKSRSLSKPARMNGRHAKITREICFQIADLLCHGLPLRYACARMNPPFPASHFAAALEKHPHLALCTDKRCAEHMMKFLDVMNDPETKLRTMPASVWVWERRFAEYFAPPKQGGGSTVVNNNTTTIIAVQEQVAARVAQLVRSGTPKAIDVTAETTKDKPVQ